MGNSQLGIRGAAGLVFALIAKTALLAELSYHADYIFALLFYPCWSRWAASFAACNYQVAKEEGMAYFFKAGQKPMYAVLSSVFVVGILILMPRPFYLAVLPSFLCVLFCCAQTQARLGGQTEDTYGLAAVTAELSFLLCYALSAVIYQGYL